MRDAIPVNPGTDPDPPNHLPPEHFKKRVRFVTVELNPVKPELSPHADDFLERCVEKDPNGFGAPYVADPTHLFRHEHPRRPGSKNETQKISTSGDGRLRVLGSGDTADLDQNGVVRHGIGRRTLKHPVGRAGRSVGAPRAPDHWSGPDAPPPERRGNPPRATDRCHRGR